LCCRDDPETHRLPAAKYYTHLRRLLTDIVKAVDLEAAMVLVVRVDRLLAGQLLVGVETAITDDLEIFA